MQKALKAVVAGAVQGNTWQKLVNPTGRGKTAFLKNLADQQRLGVRLDYDGGRRTAALTPSWRMCA
jgi:hypothetical protein